MNTNPSTAQQEASRLLNLAYYDILDSLPEQEYDDITLLAAHICDMPISLISFVDRDRQWFKSSFGLPVQQTPRDVSFCAHAILTPEQMMVVPDATQDNRFLANPLTLSAPYVRFYAGVPLVTQEGHALGTLCVIDNKPSRLSVPQSFALAALARQVIALLDLRIKDRALEQALVKERELHALKSKFVNMVSHEFRTPLTTIAISTDLLRHYVGQLHQPIELPFERHISRIQGEIIKFTDLLDGVLMVGQINAGKVAFHPQPVDMVALCRNLLNGYFNDRPDGRKVEFSVNGQPRLAEMDASLIDHTLTNLLTNAFKFSEHSPRLLIDYEPDQLRVQVIDQGIGIPALDIPFLFDSFFRASNVGELKGTGLGLSIAWQFINLHGGSLHVESYENQGTTFTISLPYQLLPINAESKPATAKPD